MAFIASYFSLSNLVIEEYNDCLEISQFSLVEQYAKYEQKFYSKNL